MDRADIQFTLATFRIIVDTREQDTAAARERMKSMGVSVERATLNYGDYAANITLPDGQNLHDVSARISPACAVERKMSLDELAWCFTRGRERFEREFTRARDAGAKVVLLVENASWEAIINHRYKSLFRPNAFMASITAWAARYDAGVLFCRAPTSGALIKEVLYRDIKERLERGEYG